MSSAIEPAIVLAAYAEPVATGRRVLFVGPALSALPARLLERGARLVHVLDPDAVRVAEATAKNRTNSISFSALSDGQLALRDGAFDVCVVEDAGITDPVSLVKRLRKALTPRGVAILATVNPEVRTPLMPHRGSGGISLDYYALYDAVKAEFEHVRMLGQAPFVGYVVADFAPEGTPEPSLDTAFLPNGAEEPELFIAVASQQPVELEAFAVVQLPYRSIVSGASESEAVRRPRSADKEARAKLAALEGELAAERQAAVDKDVELMSRRDAVAARDAQLREAETRVAARETELREAEKRATARDAELREAQTRVFARDAELAALRQELENKNHQLKAQEASLGELSARLKSGPSPEEAAAAAAELTSLEKTLAERGERIRQLERDLREAERVGKELLRQLPPAVDPAETAKKMAETELARQLAKSQADLVATRWALDASTKRTASGAENA
ncbi:MAG: TolA protein [Polyangiaceae bacterium]|jgi:2-polyprenyl-3-methyl-5-hydroxy-6-metoxy-1,4-benzoquinol methylase|nr:TolA protein [Polyangiaceae bacterium]